MRVRWHGIPLPHPSKCTLQTDQSHHGEPMSNRSKAERAVGVVGVCLTTAGKLWGIESKTEHCESTCEGGRLTVFDRGLRPLWSLRQSTNRMPGRHVRVIRCVPHHTASNECYGTAVRVDRERRVPVPSYSQPGDLKLGPRPSRVGCDRHHLTKRVAQRFGRSSLEWAVWCARRWGAIRAIHACCVSQTGRIVRIRRVPSVTRHRTNVNGATE
jgi:hypothetical protein